MTQERAKLDFAGLDEPAPRKRAVDADRIRETSVQAGFRGTTEAREERTETKPSRKRRLKRKRTGRVLQFATRLNEHTLNQIYDYAEAHQITLAEVIERALSALRNQDERKIRDDEE